MKKYINKIIMVLFVSFLFVSGQKAFATTIIPNNNLNNTNCLITHFYASPSSIDEGESSNLHWNTTGCNHVNISNLQNNLGANGDISVSPAHTTTYNLTVSGNNGSSDSQSVTISVSNNNNNNNNYNYYCVIDDFYANSSYVNSGNPVTLSWHTSNCNSAYISGIGNVNPHTGNYIVYPSYNTTYHLNASGNNGNDSQSITITVDNYNYNNNNNNNNNNNYYYNQNITTGSLTTATNSCAITSGNSTCNIHFYWNTSNPVGTSAITKSTGGTVANGNSGSTDLAVPYNAVTFMLYNNANLLANKTVYSSCIVGTFWNGSYCATPVSVPYTPPSPKPITIVQNITTVEDATSLVALKIENRFETVKAGDAIEYIVTYKNIGKTTIKDSMLQVVLPKGISFENTSRGTYTSDIKTVSVLLEDLIINKEGAVYIQAKVDSSKTEKIVTNTNLIYTSTNGAQEKAEAYVTNNIEGDGSSLGAAAILSGLSSIGLLGLFFIILIILFVVYFIRRRPVSRA